MHDQTTKHIERKKGKEEEAIDHLKYIRNYLSDKQHIAIKNVNNSDATYSQYEIDGDRYSKSYSLENYL